MSGATDRGMTISDAAESTGLSVHTLRYYERQGLIPPIDRDRSGHRRFGERELRAVALVDRLRASGMPIREVRRYVDMVRAGVGTKEARRELLLDHRARLGSKIDELAECLAIVDAKVALYEGRLDDRSELWSLIEAAQRKRRASRDP